MEKKREKGLKASGNPYKNLFIDETKVVKDDFRFYSCMGLNESCTNILMNEVSLRYCIDCTRILLIGTFVVHTRKCLVISLRRMN